ncbi:hypothetical protein TL16_g09787 [Triparma laevis f. inornata]|uniref:tRNA(Phe) 7-[(3-amino-3-carboxypropyl)-4-demethylwyosine(37)-N(4)]-methyltransferase n=1 Tax=Triparma laevis f. inornata TaxID=1714386 RepID=A0A9W7B9R5_9STRA|nr:hypothetical protein TL16_g09787 [Triparma laevis f. inornata]
MSSFASRKASALSAFSSSPYTCGEQKDASPIGAIDKPIRELCHILNSHPSYFTLSTCSGRIAVYSSPTATNASTNGKGSGTWHLSSHEPVELKKFLSLLPLPENADLEHSTALLHISCLDFPAAKLLLKIALASGFRESGIVLNSDSSKITLAIRSTGLSISTPYSSSLSREYLSFWLCTANEKFKLNAERLVRLTKNIESELVVKPYTVEGLRWERLPDLNLVDFCTLRYNKTIYVLGGYGPGPSNNKPKISSQIYSLSPPYKTWLKELTPFKGLTKHCGCVKGDVGLIFGGKVGGSGRGDLYVWELEGKRIKGLSTNIPPRWSSTLTALTGDNFGVLIGGRNEFTVFNDIYVIDEFYTFTRVQTKGDTSCLLTPPQNVKTLKTKLESLNLLDKKYRITKTSNNLMAVPIVFNEASPPSPDLGEIQKVECMFNKLDISKNSGGKKKINIKDIVEAHGGDWKGSDKVEVLGDVALLPGDFDVSFLSNLPDQTTFFTEILELTSSSKIGKKGYVKLTSEKRRPNNILLYPEHKEKEVTGEGSEGWVCVKDNGVWQWFDFTRVMFSRGNISEKIR